MAGNIIQLIHGYVIIQISFSYTAVCRHVYTGVVGHGWPGVS